jgi:hypothetical protein
MVLRATAMAGRSFTPQNFSFRAHGINHFPACNSGEEKSADKRFPKEADSSTSASEDDRLKGPSHIDF